MHITTQLVSTRAEGTAKASAPANAERLFKDAFSAASQVKPQTPAQNTREQSPAKLAEKKLTPSKLPSGRAEVTTAAVIALQGAASTPVALPQPSLNIPQSGPETATVPPPTERVQDAARSMLRAPDSLVPGLPQRGANPAGGSASSEDISDAGDPVTDNTADSASSLPVSTQSAASSSPSPSGVSGSTPASSDLQPAGVAISTTLQSAGAALSPASNLRVAQHSQDRALSSSPSHSQLRSSPDVNQKPASDPPAEVAPASTSSRPEPIFRTGTTPPSSTPLQPSSPQPTPQGTEPAQEDQPSSAAASTETPLPAQSNSAQPLAALQSVSPTGTIVPFVSVPLPAINSPAPVPPGNSGKQTGLTSSPSAPPSSTSARHKLSESEGDSDTPSSENTLSAATVPPPAQPHPPATNHQTPSTDPAFQQALQSAPPASTPSAPANSQPADPAANSAPSPLPVQAAVSTHQDSAVTSALNSAQLIQSAHGSEMRLGMHSTEFGSISINTSLSHGGLSAQISTEHSELSRALAIHMPAMQEKLGEAYGLQARVEVRESNAALYGDSSQSSQSQQSDSRHTSSRQLRPGSFTGSLSPSSPLATPSTPVLTSDARLDIRI